MNNNFDQIEFKIQKIFVEHLWILEYLSGTPHEHFKKFRILKNPTRIRSIKEALGPISKFNLVDHDRNLC